VDYRPWSFTPLEKCASSAQYPPFSSASTFPLGITFVMLSAAVRFAKRIALRSQPCSLPNLSSEGTIVHAALQGLAVASLRFVKKMLRSG